MRTPVIAANWKLQKTIPETLAFLDAFIPMVADVNYAEIVIAPPFTALYSAGLKMKGTNVKLAGQDVYHAPNGAYTGEVSAEMLLDTGCSHVIIGHSERRQIFGETDEMLNMKTKAAFDAGLTVIFCIGETLEQRQSNKTLEVLGRQITEGLKGIDLTSIIIAYEPIWAIGTGLTATPEQAQEAHAFVRGLVRTLPGGKNADGIRILYGGSVKPENIGDLMDKPDLDGALVGGASLKPESFAKIVKFKG